MDLDLNQLLDKVQVMLMMLNDEHDENVDVNDMYGDFDLNINVFHVYENLYQRPHHVLMDNNHEFLMQLHFDLAKNYIQ